VAALLGLLPAGLVALLPLIFSGGGLATALLGFLPNLRQYAVIGLAVLLGLSVVYGQTEKASYESEKAARTADRANAEAAARQAVQVDLEHSYKLVADYAAEIADLQEKSHAADIALATAPVTALPAGCPDPMSLPVVRAFSLGLPSGTGAAGAGQPANPARDGGQVPAHSR
jgi:hypothetical protein